MRRQTRGARYLPDAPQPQHVFSARKEQFVATLAPQRDHDEPQGAAGAPSLEQGTKLVQGRPIPSVSAGKWCTRAYVSAGEAVVYVPANQVGANRAQWRVVPFLGPVGENVRVSVRKRTLGDPMRRYRMTVEAQISEEEAADAARRAGLRAKAKVRRYAKANGLTRLWTLTFAPEHLPADRAGAMAAGAAFVRRLRKELGRTFPYVVVVERGSKGTRRLHVHLAAGFYIPIGQLRATWGQGYVYAQHLGDRGEAEGKVAGRVASYVAKYVEKSFEEVSSAGRRRGDHRYEVGQGFQPVAVVVEDQGDEVDALASAIALVGEGMPSYVWSSEVMEKWPGPPIRVLRW